MKFNKDKKDRNKLCRLDSVALIRKTWVIMRITNGLLQR